MAAEQKQSTNEKETSKHRLAKQKFFHLLFAKD
jgi:hypothetical protein